MLPFADRRRSPKDGFATFFTTNLLPQHGNNNAFGSAWLGFENYSRKIVEDLDKELYIIAGGYKYDAGSPTTGFPTRYLGNNVLYKDGSPVLDANGRPKLASTSDLPKDKDGNLIPGYELVWTENEKEILVPEWTWKVAVILEPGQGIADIDEKTQVLSIVTPNKSKLATPRSFTMPKGESRTIDDWGDWKQWRVSPRYIEDITGLDFLSNIPQSVQDIIEVDSNSALPLSASLQGEIYDTSLLLNDSLTIRQHSSDPTIGHGSLVPTDGSSFIENSTSQISTIPSNITDRFDLFEISSFEVSSIETSLSKSNSFEISIPEISILENRFHQTGISQVSFLQNAIDKIGLEKPRISQNSSLQNGISEVSTFGVNTNHDSVAERSVIHESVIEPSTVQPSSIQVDASQVHAPQIFISQIDPREISFASSISPEQFFSIHNSTPEITNVLNNSATKIWSDLLQSETELDIDFQITDLLKGQLAEATMTGFDDNGTPNTGTILIDHDANGVGWFIDSTPLDNSEFVAQNTDSYLLATAESEASGKYDLLTTVLHEIAHLYGFIDGYEGFDTNIKTENGTTKFIGDDFEAVLDGEHLDKSAHPHDLMNTHLAPGVRKLPSELDVQILQALIATELEQNGNNSAGEELLAALSSDPLLTISNGDFSIADTTTDSFAWDTRGASAIEDGQAVLTEDSPFLSSFTQTFTVPEEAKTIQFKLIGAELGASELAPPDAFEVALLDAETNQSLVTDNDLNNTDSLLNIQNDGTAYFSDKVRIGGATTGEIIGLDRPRTVTVDISDLTPGTEATLYFDLLGFGAADSRVVIDDVRLSDQFLLPPVANDDTATVTQGDTVEIDILANDTDDDGTLDPNSVQITTEPANGTATVNDNGTVDYTPSDRFVGEDSFTYTVQDNDEQQSEIATVDITVENAIPVISEVQIPDTVIEGVEVSLNAIASDAGNDELTYSWTMDGEALTEASQQINYTFPDNGTYTGSVTVTDTHGGSATQTFDVTVENAVPVVDAGVDVTVDEGSSVEFAGSYSDTGINDTHTVSWDFGDGDTADASEVSHIYTDDGEYTATYTVTDNDGAVASDTVEVTVNNVAPVIESLTGDTEINEGDTATFNAIATDPGSDTITYIWDFGDGSQESGVRSQGSEVTHTYVDNGEYTVTLTVRDEDGGENIQTLDVTVNNVASTFDEVSGATEVDEGEAVDYSAIASDPGDDELTYTWNFGDGTPEVAGADVVHTFTNNGIYDATVTVTDDDGAATTSELTITVNNVAPTLNTETSKTEEEGTAVNFEANFGDVGNDDLTVTWDFGDGSEIVNTNYGANSEVRNETQSHLYQADGVYIATVTVIDSDGAVTESNIEVTIDNVAPTIEYLTGQTEVDEGDVASFNALAIDSGGDTLTYTWDFGDGSELITVDRDELPIDHTYADNGEYTVTLTVTDTAGATDTRTLNIVVRNTSPVITEISDDTTINEGDALALGVTATDAGNDELTYAWDFGDGSDVVMGENVEHIFVDNGLYTASVTVIDDDGASVTQNLTITVNNVAPIIDPWSDETSTEGDTIEFNASFSDPGVLDTHAVNWDFGDGSTVSDTLTPEHVYADNGVYEVTLTVTDNDGASTSSSIDVTVNNAAPAIVSLTGDTEVDEGGSASFAIAATDRGANDTLTYSWDFGDGSTATGTEVTHTYTQNGNYTVTATVTDKDGASINSTIEVRVNNVAPKIVEFDGERLLNEGDTATYSVTATDAGADELTYTWNLPDGSTISGENTSITYTFFEDGDYDFEVTVRDSDGAATTEVMTVVVNNVAPILDVVPEDTSEEGSLVEFNASFRDPGVLDTHTIAWDFGDGSIVTDTLTPTHTYADDGEYDATITVTDDEGAATAYEFTITVVNVPPSLSEIEAKTTVDEGESASFSATASDPGNDELTYTWNFGDGNEPITTSNITPILHTYSDNGDYTVELTVRDGDGGVTTSQLNITVSNIAPTVEVVNELVGSEGTAVEFNASFSDPGVLDTHTVEWDFGDGNTASDVMTPVHIYGDDGVYDVTLTITDNDGASTTVPVTVNINNIAPTIVTTDIDSVINEGEIASFSATASDPGNDELTYIWNFGDGNEPVTTSNNLTPIPHTYSDSGDYTVELTVNDDDGASDSQTFELTVNNVAPIISAIATEDEIYDGVPTLFKAIAFDPGNDELTYTWDLGDGSTATGVEINHTYDYAGDYIVKLTVTDDDGAEVSQTSEISVRPTVKSNLKFVQDRLRSKIFEAGVLVEEIRGKQNQPVTTNFERINLTAVDSPDIPNAKTDVTFLDNGEGIGVTDGDDYNSSLKKRIDGDEALEIKLSATENYNSALSATLKIDRLQSISNNANGGQVRVVALLQGKVVDEQSFTFNNRRQTFTFNSDLPFNSLQLMAGDTNTKFTLREVELATVNYLLPTPETIDPPISRLTFYQDRLTSKIFANGYLVESYTGRQNQPLTDQMQRLTVEAIDSQDLTYLDNGEGIGIRDGEDGNSSRKKRIDGDETLAISIQPTTDYNGATQAIVTLDKVRAVKGNSQGGTIKLAAYWQGNLVKEELYALDSEREQITLDSDLPFDRLAISAGDNNTKFTFRVVDFATTSVWVDSLTANEGEIINFAAPSNLIDSQLSWDFGDGTTETGAQVAHTYTDNGIYTVTLVNLDDSQSNLTATVTVNNLAPGIVELEGNTLIPLGSVATFTGSASDPGNDELTYIWEFGDESPQLAVSSDQLPVTHRYINPGNYTVTLTVEDGDGGTDSQSVGVTVIDPDAPQRKFYNLKAEGKVRINGNSNLEGEVTNTEDDTHIYAGSGFTINGNQTLPVLRDTAGNPIKQNNKPVLVEGAIAVGANYTESNASAIKNKYIGVIPPQVIEELSVTVPAHQSLIDEVLTTKNANLANVVSFNPQQNPLNNQADWNQRFPAPGTKEEPTLVRISNGGLNIPNGVDLNNTVIIVEQGDINFNGSGHTFDNVVLNAENGSINLSAVESNDLAIFAANTININSQARFGGDTLIATGNNFSNLHFDGATSTLDNNSNLRIVSQGNIIFNSSSTTRGEFMAAGNFTANGNTSLIGAIEVKGDITINGGIDLKASS